MKMYDRNTAEEPAVCGDELTGNFSRDVEENHQVVVSCSITYRGNWNPEFECYPAAVTNNINKTVPNTVLYSHTINVNRSLHNFSCHIKEYAKRDGSGFTAHATDDSYHYQWQSPPINVTCKFYIDNLLNLRHKTLMR
jgi:hypothetical protein